MKAFQSHRKGGVSFTYDNGYTISIQFKYGSYCDTNATDFKFDDDVKSDNTEIAVMKPNGDWYTREVYQSIFNEDIGDDVVGYVTVEDVLKIQNYIKDLL